MVALGIYFSLDFSKGKVREFNRWPGEETEWPPFVSFISYSRSSLFNVPIPSLRGDICTTAVGDGIAH